MTTLRQNKRHAWFDEAIRHLDSLHKEAIEYCEEGDILPTDNEIRCAKRLMAELNAVDAPQIAITVNGEVLLTWKILGDCLIARIGRDGTARFYKDKKIAHFLN